MSVFTKLQDCRVELQQMELKKSGKNSYSGFSYFNLGDFLPNINTLFQKHKLFSNFSISGENATLTIIDCENPEEKIVFTSPIAELELKGCNKIQALGGVHTYLKRYLYMNALEIIENDLFDVMSGKSKNVKSKTTTKPNNENSNSDDKFITLTQKDELKAKLGGAEFARVMNEVNGKLTVEQFNQIMNEKCMQVK